MDFDITNYPNIIFDAFAKINNDSASLGDQHKALLGFSEKFLFYIAGIMLGEYKSTQTANKIIETELYQFARRHPSFGQVWGFVRLLCNELDSSIVKDKVLANYSHPSFLKLVSVFKTLVDLINNGTLKDFDSHIDTDFAESNGIPLKNVIDCIISIRNKSAHPELKGKSYSWPLTSEYFEVINPILEDVTRDILKDFEIIADYKPFAVTSENQDKNTVTGVLEIGKIDKKNTTEITTSSERPIFVGETYLLDSESNIFSKLYFNNFPGPSTEIVKEILKDQKTKELIPHLEEMIKDKLLGDSKIDDMEYFVLKDMGKNASLSEVQLFALIEKMSKSLGIKSTIGTPDAPGDLFINSKEMHTGPTFNIWWLSYFGILGNYKPEVIVTEKSLVEKSNVEFQAAKKEHIGIQKDIGKKTKEIKKLSQKISKASDKSKLNEQRNKTGLEISGLKDNLKESKIQMNQAMDDVIKSKNHTLWGIHQGLWDEISDYLNEVCSESINKNVSEDNSTINWVNSVSNWQQGELSHYYWGRLHPEQAPLGSMFNIGYVVIKTPKNLLKKNINIHPDLKDQMKTPGTWVYLTAQNKTLTQIDKNNLLGDKYSDIQKEWINDNKEELIKMGANIRCINLDDENAKQEFLPIQHYLANSENKKVYWTYSKIWNKHDFQTNGKLSKKKVQKYQSETMAYFQIFSNVINKMNNFALENGINQETIKEKGLINA